MDITTEEKRSTEIFFYRFFFGALLFVEPICSVWWPQQSFHVPYGFCCIGVLFLLWKGCQRADNTQKRKVSYVDLLFLCLFIYNLPDVIGQGYLSQGLLYVLVYVFSKQWGNNNDIHVLLIGIGILQAAIMGLQAVGCLEADGPSPITGSFHNSGTLGGCLSLSIAALIARRQTMKRKAFIPLLFLLGGALAITESRAAWMATVIVLLYEWMQRKNTKPILQIGIYAVTFIIVASIFLTLYKPDSGKGRLLIWTVSMEIIKEKPFTGQGFTGFQQAYMNHQSQYLKEHPDHPGNRLAANNRFAFNEFLRIACEQGIIAALSVIVVLAALSVRCIRRKDNLYPCLLAFVVFACFSYPCSVWLLNILLAAFMGTLSRRIDGMAISVSGYRYRSVRLLLLAGLLFHTGGYAWKKDAGLEKALNRFALESDQQALQKLQENYGQISRSPEKMFRYARTLYLKGEYRAAIPVISRAISFYPTTDKFCELGNAYREVGEQGRAAQAYRQAIGLLPHWVYPRYCLFLLYKENCEPEKAASTARELLRITPKIDNRQYREIKRSVETYLQPSSCVPEGNDQ